MDEYLQALKTLSKDCNFKDVTAAQHQEESVRDLFISGLQSSLIRQCLLENKTLEWATVFDQARALDSALKSSELYSVSSGSSFSATASEPRSAIEDSPDCSSVSAAVGNKVNTSFAVTQSIRAQDVLHARPHVTSFGFFCIPCRGSYES